MQIFVFQLLPVVASSVVEMTSVLNNSPLHGMLGSSLEKMENTENDNITSAMINYWSELADRIIERMDSEEEAVTMAIVGRVVTLVRSLVSPPISCKVEEKLGKMKLSASDENSLQKGRERNSLTKGMSLFIQRLTLYAFQSAHKHFNAPCLNLFASLMELNPAEDTIKSVIESCHGDVETDQSHSNYFVFNVCLPWLQKIEADDQKHVISIICTFMAMLDNSSLTALLQTLTEVHVSLYLPNAFQTFKFHDIHTTQMHLCATKCFRFTLIGLKTSRNYHYPYIYYPVHQAHFSLHMRAKNNFKPGSDIQNIDDKITVDRCFV